MPAEEVASWKAFLRRNPRGFEWDNWVQATLHRAMVISGRNGSEEGVARFDKFLWRRPVPLEVERLKADAKAATKAAAAKKKRKR